MVQTIWALVITSGRGEDGCDPGEGWGENEWGGNIAHDCAVLPIEWCVRYLSLTAM